MLSARFAESDVMLTNAHGVFDRSIAETVVGMMLVFAKDMLRTFELQRRRTWLHRETEMLAGRTALVVGAGGLGEPIITGLNLNDHRLILEGALPAAALAIVVELLFEWVERALIPAHLRN